MPTVAMLRDLAATQGVRGASKMKKDELIRVLGRDVVERLDCATKLPDVFAYKKYREGDNVYKKVWELKEPSKLYLAVLRSPEDKVMLVKGSVAGRGLGLGGAKWTYESKKL